MSDPRKVIGGGIGGERDKDLDASVMRGLAAGPGAPVKVRQPAGLYLLFTVEMWERFSFYGMKALLVLYLIKSSTEGGLEWSKDHAGMLMGWYSGLVYLTPIIGGYLADRFLGTHRSLLIGGAIIASGHFLLMMEGLVGLFGGLSLVVIGTGFFKSNVSTMVGQLYKQGDPRRDAGFTIFYMGINLGAFIAPLICGYLRTKYGWPYGFGAAGVGMVVGLIIYSILRNRYLAGIGDAPTHTSISAAELEERRRPLTTEEWQRVAVVCIMAFFVFFFWASFEQSGNSMSAFAEERTDRTTPKWLEFAVPEDANVQAPDAQALADAATAVTAAALPPPPAKPGFRAYPAEWFQSVNALMILILAPIFAVLWVRLARIGREPGTLLKMALGLIGVGGGFAFMVVGAKLSADGGGINRVSPMFLVGAFLIHTIAELCLSPVGLSLVTRLAPLKFASLLMGAWFLANFFANLTAGLSLGMSETFDKGKGFFHLFGGQADFFLIWVVLPVAAGLVLMGLLPVLRKMTHGRA